MFVEDRVVVSARLASLALLLAAGTACGRLHALTEYYPDSGSESVLDDTGSDDTGPVDTGPDDTGPVDTGPVDTGPVDTGSGGTLCENTCTYYGDGECDDGGPGADWDLCTYGTDCADCGPRTDDGGGTTGCTDDCPFYADGECDDGGPGSMWSVCDLGTDCSDCGPR